MGTNHPRQFVMELMPQIAGILDLETDQVLDIEDLVTREANRKRDPVHTVVEKVARNHEGAAKQAGCSLRQQVRLKEMNSLTVVNIHKEFDVVMRSEHCVLKLHRTGR